MIKAFGVQMIFINFVSETVVSEMTVSEIVDN